MRPSRDTDPSDSPAHSRHFLTRPSWGVTTATLSSSVKETDSAAQGLVSIAGAKIFFIITSYAVQLLLPRIFGSPKEFGLYATAMSGVAMLNNVLIAATIQSVSKFVSENESASPGIVRQGLTLQLVVGGLLSLSLFAAAPYLAAILFDDNVTLLLRIASVVVFVYALYAVLVGSLNGRRLFTKQARLDATFSLLRTAGIVGGALLGFGAIGAIAGFASAATAILCVALVVVGLGKRGEQVPWGKWAAFMTPIWIYQGCLNGILQIDVQVLKRTVAELSLANGMIGTEAADLASQYVGFYRGAQTFAFVPYQLIIAMTFIVFPMVSRATSTGAIEEARATIRNAIRFSMLLLMSVAAPVAGAADGVMRLAYPSEYVAGAPALAILVFGIAAFALFVVSATVISSAGKPSIAALIAFVCLAVVLIANRFAIQSVGVGENTLAAAAAATSVGMVLALLASASVIYFKFGTFANPWTIARCAVASAIAYAVAHFIPHDTALMALLCLIAAFVAYAFTLIVTAELGRADLDAIRSVLRR